MTVTTVPLRLPRAEGDSGAFFAGCFRRYEEEAVGEEIILVRRHRLHHRVFLKVLRVLQPEDSSRRRTTPAQIPDFNRKMAGRLTAIWRLATSVSTQDRIWGH
jgi:hypothetical protein